MPYYYIISLVQIVLESFPISSSSHIVLLEHFIGDGCKNTYLLYLLHIPTVCILFFFFRTKMMGLLYSIIRNWSLAMKICLLVGMIDAITVCSFVVLRYVPITIPLSCGLLITALLLYSLRYHTSETNELQYWHTLVLGCAQSCALLPGISRFASVYATARFLGISHRRAFEITWLCAVPLFLAPILLVLQHGLPLMDDPLFFLVISVAAFVSYYVLYSAQWLAANNYIWLLSIYMVIPFLFSLLCM